MEGLSLGWSRNLDRNHTSEDEIDKIETTAGDVDNYLSYVAGWSE